MTFLKKLGQILAQGTAVLMGFGPMVSALYPKTAGAIQTVESDLSQVAQIVALMEGAFQVPGSGVQKLQGATPLVAQIVLQSSMMVGHKIEKPELFKQGCQELASGMADILNALHPDGVSAQNVAA